MKCEKCQDRGFTEENHGLTAILCDCEAGKKKREELGLPDPDGGIILPPKNMEPVENEPIIPLSQMEEAINDLNSGTGQSDTITGSDNPSKPKQPRKQRAKKKARKGIS